jgi:hypothetical protein
MKPKFRVVFYNVVVKGTAALLFQARDLSFLRPAGRQLF